MNGGIVTSVVAVASLLLTLPVGSPAYALEASRHTLGNGLRLVLSQQASVPIVSIDCLVDGGARVDPRGQPGLAGLTADLLDEGTQTRSAKEIARRIDSIGGSLGTGASADWIHVGAAVLSRDFDAGMELVAESLRTPTFPKEEVERIRRETLGALEAAEENPGTVASRSFRQAVFGEAPYGYPVAGTPESVASISRDQIIAFHKRTMTPDHTICAIVGDVSEATMLEAAKETLGDWTGQGVLEARHAAVPPATREIVIDRPTAQANIMIGQLGIERSDPDYFAVLLMNHVLGGGGFTSRLVEEVRTKKGLAYAIYSRFASTRLRGSFRVTLQTKTESAREAIAIVRREISRMHEAGVSEEELAAAKDYLTGSFPLKLDSTAKLSGLLAQIEYFGLGPDYLESYSSRIRAVSREDVAAAARRHLRPEALILVVVGNEEKLGLSPRVQP